LQNIEIPVRAEVYGIFLPFPHKRNGARKTARPPAIDPREKVPEIADSGGFIEAPRQRLKKSRRNPASTDGLTQLLEAPGTPAGHNAFADQIARAAPAPKGSADVRHDVERARKPA
jgi:hypothetical protein